MSLEATIEHVKKTQPDVFFTTVAYPIKGTPYYEEVRDRIVQPASWQSSSDREFRIRGRHSRRFYQYADRLLRDEVALSKLKGNGATPSAGFADLKLQIENARSGLLTAFGEVEA